MRRELALLTALVATACAPEWNMQRDVGGGFNVRMPTASPQRELVDGDTFFGPDAAAELEISEVSTMMAGVLSDRGTASRIVGFHPHEDRAMSLYRVFHAALPSGELVADEAEVLEQFRDATLNRFRSDESPICTRELVRESVVEDYSPSRLEYWYEQACTDDAPLVVLVRSQILVSRGRVYGLEVHGAKAGTHQTLTFEEASSDDAEAFFASFHIDR